MSRSIREMKKGDFVKTSDGKLHEIESVDGSFPKHWSINTKDGRNVDMWESYGYYKKEDIRNEVK